MKKHKESYEQLEKKLEKTQKKYKQLIEHAPTGIYEIDLINRKFILVNDVMTEYTGFSKKELLSMDPMNLLTEKSSKKFNQRLQAVSDGEKPPNKVEYEIKTKDGNIIWTLLNITFIKDKGKIIRALVIAHDISKRKKLEEKLAQSNTLLDTLIKKVPIGFAYIDRDLRFQLVNEKLTELNGLSIEEHLGKHIKEVVPSLYPTLKKIIQKIINTKKPVKSHEFKGETSAKPGLIRYWNEHWYPVFNYNDEIIGFGAIVEEITDRKKFEQRLRENQKRLQKAEQLARLGNVEYDVKQRKIYWSKMLYDLYERNPDLGPPSYEEIMNLHPPDDAKLLRQKVSNAIKNKEPYDIDIKATLPSGKNTFFHVIGNPIADDNGNVIRISGTVQDITDRKEIEKILLDREERLRLSQKAAGVISWELNIKTNKIMWLGEINKIFGQLSKEDINTFDKFIKRVHPEDRSDVKNILKDCISDKNEFWIEHRIIQPDGKICWVEKSGNIYHDKQGKPDSALGIIHDITKEKNWEALQTQLDKEIQKERDLLQVIMENTPAHLAYFDSEFNFIMVNTAYAESTGYRPDELIGKNHFDLFPDKENEQVFKQVREKKEKVEFEAKPFIVPGSEEESYWNWTLTPILDEKDIVVGLVLSLLNVTAIKETEEKIRSLNVSLIKRTRDLSIANKELEAFTYSASHDLRAPLRSINGFSEILLEEYHDSLDKQAKDYLQRICKSAGRMSQLINDLLKLSRISRSKLKKTTVDLSTLANEVVNELQQQNPERKVQLDIESGLVDQGDKNLLRIVLRNLIGNAWKFTKNTKYPEITIGKMKKNNDFIYYVRDNGDGFNDKYADKLFIPFQRLHDESEFPGTGIGLPLVSRIIHRHNGEIWGEGKKGKGATFFFSLNLTN